MAFDDIGQIIFVQLLQMTEYPGSPFTGEIARDLIMFLLVPSVFIILLIYMIIGRLFGMTAVGAQQKLRLLVGITIYLFIIAGGYYRAFALLAGPYFLFLIFVLGLFYFIFSHFGVQAGGGGPYREGGAFRTGGGNDSSVAHYENMNYLQLMKAKKRIQTRLEDVEKEIHAAEAGKVEEDLQYLRRERVNLKQELREVDRQLNLGKRLGW